MSSVRARLMCETATPIVWPSIRRRVPHRKRELTILGTLQLGRDPVHGTTASSLQPSSVRVKNVLWFGLMAIWYQSTLSGSMTMIA